MNDKTKRGSTVLVDPFRCRMWSQNYRLESDLTEESCGDEIKSFTTHGQLIPVLGRPIRGDADADVELIYGARRLFVARYVRKPILVELRDLSDREAIVAMDIENRQRTDLSPYERGLSYASWLRSGTFRSQEDLAKALKLSPPVVSKMLRAAKLPSAILCAFASPIDIREGWALDLFQAVEDTRRRQRTLSEARNIAATSPRPPAREIYRRLMAVGSEGRPLRARARDEVVKNRFGKPIFRIRHQSKSLSVVFPVESLSADMLERIRTILSDFLSVSGSRSGDHRGTARRGRDRRGVAGEESKAVGREEASDPLRGFAQLQRRNGYGVE
jgi:ParB/RepB/Spo0J family partition protein